MLTSKSASRMPLKPLPVAAGAVRWNGVMLKKILATTDGSDLQGLSRSRTDLTGSVAWRVAPALAVAAGLGRTVSSLDQNGATLLASASISYSITPRERPQTPAR